MATESFITTRGAFLLAKGDLDFDIADLRVALITSPQTWATGRLINTMNELAGVECAVAGYARRPLTGVNILENDTDGRVDIDFSDMTFPPLASGATIHQAVVYMHNPAGDSSSQVIAVCGGPNFPLATSGATLNLTINVLFRIAALPG